MGDGPTIVLPARQLFELPDAGAAGVLCTSGCLWLTVDGDVRDVVLFPGDRFETGENRRALIYAFEPSAFTLLAQALRHGPAKSHAAASRSPVVWAATRAAGCG